MRADSAYYGHDLAAAAHRAGARFSVTARMNLAVTAAISSIPEDAWVPIRYPNAIWDEDEQRLVSDAEVAEIPFTAFTSRRKSEHIAARLIVRRVKRLNLTSVPAGQGELFATYRHHGVFTDTPLPMLQAEAAHRAHAIIEQVHADLRSGPLAHAPCGSWFAANSAWLVLAAIAFNLTRAAGALASLFHAKATTATIRDQLIGVPARLARSARRLRTTKHSKDLTTPAPTGTTKEPERGRAGQTGGPRTPSPRTTRKSRHTPSREPGRWIRAQSNR